VQFDVHVLSQYTQLVEIKLISLLGLSFSLTGKVCLLTGTLTTVCYIGINFHGFFCFSFPRKTTRHRPLPVDVSWLQSDEIRARKMASVCWSAVHMDRWSSSLNVSRKLTVVGARFKVVSQFDGLLNDVVSCSR
jgi:hypothetical protein